MRSFIRSIRQVSMLEGDGRRLLDSHELKLDWRPLWQRLQDELHSETTTAASVIPLIHAHGLMLYSQLIELACACKEYYSAEEIPDMLKEILPLLNPEVCGFFVECISLTLFRRRPWSQSSYPPSFRHPSLEHSFRFCFRWRKASTLF